MTTEWMQDLFDLMANERVQVTIRGEMGDVDAILAFPQSRPDLEPWRSVTATPSRKRCRT